MGIKASKICCPFCDKIIVEEKNRIVAGKYQSDLADMFNSHLEIHKVQMTTETRDELHTRIIFIRSNGKIPYTDPFIVVPPERCPKL
jgi:hypothetical protein